MWLASLPSLLTPGGPSSSSVAPVAAHSQEASSSAAQSCSAPPNGTITIASGPGATIVPSRATSIATSHGDLSSTVPTPSRGIPSPIIERRPSSRIEVDLLAAGQPHEVAAGVGGGERHRAGGDAEVEQFEPRALHLIGGDVDEMGLGLQPAAHGRAARRRHETGEDELALRLPRRQRRGDGEQGLERGVRLGRDENRPRRLGEPPRPTSREAAASSSSGGDPNVPFGSISRISGPVISVVTIAITTSAANRAAVITPRSSARLRTISSVSPRVFISVLSAADSRHGIFIVRAAIIVPPNFPSDRDRDQTRP